MRYQVEFLLPLKQKKNILFWVMLENSLGQTFDLFDLLILLPGVHCYIVLVLFSFKPQQRYFYL